VPQWRSWENIINGRQDRRLLDCRQTLNCMLDDDQSAGREPTSGTAAALAWSEGTKHNEYKDSRIMNTAELSARAPLAKPASRSRADERGASASGNVERRSFLKALGTAGAAVSASALAGTAAVAQANRAQISKGDAALLRFGIPSFEAPQKHLSTRWIMNSFNFGHAAIKRSSMLVACTLLLLVLVVPVPSAYAAPDAITPVEDFSRELDKLKKSFGDLGKKIDDSAKMIDGLSDVDKAKKEIEDLRAAVGSLLDLVADNGALDKLGDKALSRARDKLKELEQDDRFKPEEKNFLIEQWRRLRDDTERATEELGSARKRFAELLRTLQASEDFIDELVQIRQAQKVIDAIHQLTSEIRGASDQLHRLIAGIKPPGA